MVEDGERETERPKQENFIITVKELKRAIAKISIWKAAEPDQVQGFWFKKATGLHLKLSTSTGVCEP